MLMACLVAAGCGDDDARPTDAARPDGATPFVSLSEAEGVIEQGRIAVVRTGGSADVGGVDGEPDRAETAVVDGARYASQSGREFDLLIFRSASAARRASSSVVDVEDGESAIRAANVIAVFPERYNDVDAYRSVARALRRLAVACGPDEAGESELRRLCFGPDGTAPDGEGVDRDEAQDEEEPIVVDGLRYDPLIARRLNPNIVPDKTFVSGRSPPTGKVWFGVFVRVCNRGEQERQASDRLALVDAFGGRTAPSGALESDNPFAYRPRSLKPGRCMPPPGSVAGRNDGVLILFAVDSELLGDPPVALEVEERRVILDV